MSKPIVFHYGINLREGGKINLFPGAKVEFKTKAGEWLTFFLIIDSGATVSALPKSDAETLGVINVAAGIPILVAGIGDQYLKGWQHNTTIKFDGKQLRIPVSFLESDNAPRILGRSGVFDHFTIVFEESMKRTGFFEESTKEHRIIQKLLEGK